MQIRRLTIGYPGHELPGELSFDILPGECLLLAGPNGCGKSTLLRILAGVIRPLSGSIVPETGPSPESVVLLPTGIPKVKGFTVEDFIRTACYNGSRWSGAMDPEAERRMGEALSLLGIRPLARTDIARLSDGQFQLACIASALTRRAQILLLDEPTAFLDVDNRIMLLRTLRDLTRRTGIAVLFSSHDVQDALAVADRVLGWSPEGTFLCSEATPSSRSAVLKTIFPAI